MNAITTTSTPEPVMLGFLQRAVADPNFDVQKFEVVLGAMREEQAKHAEREFYRAMALAQGEMEPVRKDATNPHTKSKYAKFEAIDAEIRPIYTRHGFSVSYRTGAPSHPGVIRMICTVAHAAGHSVEAELEAALDNSGTAGRSNKTDVQAVGSTVSYLRRYILNMVWNVALASEDDDGEGSRRKEPAASRDEPATPKPDLARNFANRFKQRMADVRDILTREGHDDALVEYNGIIKNQGVIANWDTIRDQRPELDAEMQAEASMTLKLITDSNALPPDDAGKPTHPMNRLSGSELDSTLGGDGWDDEKPVAGGK